MFSNATVTITTRGANYDEDSGYRKSATQEDILTDVPCVFSQSKNASRSVNANGIREYVKPVYSLLIPGYPDAEIGPGCQAEVTPDQGPAQTFTISDAVFTVGIAEGHWECDIDRIKVPA